jgi:uncharacterized SAM-binding protein YcdF (DUF218 family)
MFFRLKALLKILVLPPAGPLLLAALGVWLVLRRGASGAARRAGWALILSCLAALWLLSMPLVAEVLTRLAERYPALDLAEPLRAQAVVILGGGRARFAPEYGGAALSDELLERVSYGAYVAHRTGLPVLISGDPNEALAMREVLPRDFGITPRWVAADSEDTFTDAELSAGLLRPAGISRIVLVTSATHEWRAAHEFLSAGFEVTPAPVHVWAPRAHPMSHYLPESRALLESTEALYELCGNGMRQVFAAVHLRRHPMPPAQ